MKIEESSVRLSASHEFQSSSSHESTTVMSFRQVIGGLQAADAAEADKADAERQRVTRLLQSLIDALIAAMDGQAGKPCTAENLAGDLPAEEGEAAAGPQRVVSWQSTETVSYSESESTRVCGSGQVKTADGRCIAFDFGLDMQRRYTSEQRETQSGEVVLKDPLVLNFSGTAAELGDTRIDFDLDADGKPEQIPGLGTGNGFLVFDRNGNGRADDGRELFGATSGDGFADLAGLDADGNGWIDEGDPDFAKLRVWDGGDGYATLAARGVGALWTSAVDAPFALKTADNALLGQIRAVGLYLEESGKVGAMQQVDLSVSAPSEQQPEKGQQLAA